jgi:hypothetical protein
VSSLSSSVKLSALSTARSTPSPFFQRPAGLLDLVTGRRLLGYFVRRNLCVLGMGCVGIFSCCFYLTQIERSNRWSAAAFSIIYLSCLGLPGTS